MGEWAWSTCNCGKRVHINFRCSCGGDPWGIADKARNRIDELTNKKDKLIGEIDKIDKEIKQLKKKL